MSLGVALALLAGIGLILLNAFFVAYEFAVVAARRSSFAEGGRSDGRVAAAARSSLADVSMQLAGAQLGITMATLALGRIGEPALEALLQNVLHHNFSPEASHTISFIIALVVFTFLHLIFGEMVPKNVALVAPDATLRWLVLPYNAYLFLFRPIIALMNGLANLGCRLVGIEPRDELLSVHTASELSAIVTHSSQGGAIEAADAELLQGVLDFAERPVGAIATPLDAHPSVLLGATAAQLERVIAASRADGGDQSASSLDRVVVLPPGGGDPMGYLHVRDLLGVPVADRRKPINANLVRQMAVVRSDRSLNDVLRVMRSVGRQLALVRPGPDDPSELRIVAVEQVVEALIHRSEATEGEAVDA